MKYSRRASLRFPTFFTGILFAVSIHNAPAQAPEGALGNQAPTDNFRAAGPGGPRFMGPGGPMGQELKVVDQFDRNSDGWLNLGERKAAREHVQKERAQNQAGGFGRRGGPGGPGGRENMPPPEPGKKVSPSDVESYPDAPLYAPTILRTFFLEFENRDWEKELSDFRNTDVEILAKLMVDGKTYTDVGIHFRGMSSLGVPEGRKRSLNLSLDLVHKDQNVGGYRTLNLLNSHEDPTFLRPVLFYEIARNYLPAPKANFVRVVINGEDWGIYSSVQQFNKDFVKEWFGTTKGARWKVRGNPGGQGSLAYLGDDPEPYKRIYTIKSKDDPKAWADFIKMCKVLNETPVEKLEAELSPLLNIDGALKFLALDNGLINNDGYWIRTSDYSIYQDVKGQFHIIPQDANETFAKPGGPGFRGGPGGPRMFGPAGMLVPTFLNDGDKDQDGAISSKEMVALAETWFAKLDTKEAGKLNLEQFTEVLSALVPPPDGFRGPPGGGGFTPGRMIAPALFTASDQDKDGELTQEEMKMTFSKWSSDWDADKSTTLVEEELRTGLAAVIPPPNFGPGGPGGSGGGPGRGFGPPRRPMPPVEGVRLDPLAAAPDENKPLISKLLAVPALKERYLAYVRDIAEKHLDWNKLGPIAERYHNLIAPVVREETRALDTTEAFEKSLTTDLEGRGDFGRIGISLKSFADQRREYLLNYKETPVEKK